MLKALKSLNFARTVILLCLLGSLPLGYFGWDRYTKNREMFAAIAPGGQAEKLVRDTQKLSRQYSQLLKERDADRLHGQANPESYIRSVAWKDRIDLGQLKIAPSEKSLGNGIVDKIYRITPDKKDKVFFRSQIANFLYTLESDSPRVRVTQVKIETIDRRPKPEDIPTDKWNFEARITSRQRQETR